jgi:predicted dehydrogenase
MKSINIALIGIGRFGKKYFKEILINKKVNCSFIVKKKKLTKNFFHLKKKLSIILNKNDIPFKNIQGAIVVTPVESHYQNAVFFLKKKIPIILEKPATNTLTEVVKLDKLSKKNRTSVLVNYSDLYNNSFNFILKNKLKIGSIKKIDICFQKRQSIYKKHSPFLDQLPHFLAIASNFIDINGDCRVLENNFSRKKNFLYQTISCNLINKKKQNLNIKFSNYLLKKNGTAIFYGTKGILSYDRYNDKKNFLKIENNKIFFRKKPKNYKISTIQNILNIFYRVIRDDRYINDLTLSIKIQKVIDKFKTLKNFYLSILLLTAIKLVILKYSSISL